MSEESKSGAETPLLVGIDLGTSRSAIAGSNGDRAWLESYVGWPRDFIARKVLGKDVMFGSEALENRLSLELSRPLEHGVIKEGTSRDEESVRELVRHLLELGGRVEGQPVKAVVGVPAESLKVSRLAIKRAVADNVDALMVASEPFTVAYGLGALNHALCIDIGAGTVDFCIMHGTLPGEEDQRTLLAAGDHIDRQLLQILREEHPEADWTLNMVRRFKEQHGFVGEPPGPVEVQVPVAGRQTTIDITGAMGRACESILPGLVETAVELVARFDPEFQSRVWGNIICAGGGSQLHGLTAYLERALEDYGAGPVRCVEDPLYAGAEGALALARDMPEEYWEQL